jgi:hypothetical protein
MVFAVPAFLSNNTHIAQPGFRTSVRPPVLYKLTISRFRLKFIPRHCTSAVK